MEDKKANIRNNGTNDIDLNEWKNYEDILFDSLWIIHERDKSGAHSNSYHGNFVPQIPNQLIRRFSRPGDLVLDPFLGSGTTLIETQRLGRLGIGVELQEKVALGAINAIESELSLDDQGKQRVIVGDTNDPRTIIEIKNSALNLGVDSSKLIILHPPYDDIIKFSDDPRDLSNQVDTATFIKKFGEIVRKLMPLLSSKGHLAIVIGDKYSGGEWIPLGFQLMSETKKVAPELILKSTIVKNMAGNRGKLNQEQLWKYRSLSGGFYIFKHEYIFLFKKSK
jgi:hypothetical protein